MDKKTDADLVEGIELKMEVVTESESEDTGKENTSGDIDIEYPEDVAAPATSGEAFPEDVENWNLLVNKVKLEEPDSVDLDPEESYGQNDPEEADADEEEEILPTTERRSPRNAAKASAAAGSDRRKAKQRNALRRKDADTAKPTRTGIAAKINGASAAKVSKVAAAAAAASPAAAEEVGGVRRGEIEEDIQWYECTLCPFSANQEAAVAGHVTKVHAKK